ncbi:MAG: NADH-quinone oxidoreductase subunit NuoG [Pseudomonadota bacterium]
MATFYIDDKAFEAEDGENILKACLSLGLDLPYFCWHPEMGSVGACRQCALVQYRDEEDTRGRIVMGCMTPVTDGARFSLQGEAPKEFREHIVESLMLNHPHDCPVCAEGGECHLQDMTVMVGHRDRRYRGKKNTHRNQDLGPLIHHEMNRCITCYRCTRYYQDYAGGRDLAAQAAHDHVYFGRHEDGTLESPFAGNLVEVCPTGVFTDKPLVNDYTRKWDMQSAPSVCNSCAVGCNTLPGERYGKLKRIHNRYNNEVNGYFLCDRGRYGSAYTNDESRPGYAGLRNKDGSYDAIQSSQAIKTVADWCGSDKKVAAIGSPRASLESNYLLRHLVGAENFCNGMADNESQLVGRIQEILRDGAVSTPSIRQVETADAILILGQDVTNTAARMALALRQSVRNLARQMAADMHIPLWQDEAVRNLAQDRLSPLFIIATGATPLDDVAEQTLSLSPAEIARFGEAVTAELNGTSASSELDDQAAALAKRVAEALSAAENPIVVSGTGCQSLDVVNAAASVAHALKQDSRMLSYCLPECNSMGSSLLSNQDASLAELGERATRDDIDCLIVLENDLHRRAQNDQIKALLENAGQVVVLDSNVTATMSTANLVLPTTTYIEAAGTLVSSEGRAQRHYPVYLPTEERQPSWRWLLQLGQFLNRDGFDEWEHFDQVTAACAADITALAKITEASPSADYRDHGLKVPRQSHRYSGRTAMLADISVHEPKQPVDDETPLAYTMEGSNSKDKPGALLPYVWSPGWNSNQSLHKFQSEAGGALSGGTAGIRLIEASGSENIASSKTDPDPLPDGHWQLVPAYHIFGSEELSAQSPAIAELIGIESIQLNSVDADRLGATDGDLLHIESNGQSLQLAAEVNDSIASGCAAYRAGLPGGHWIAPNCGATISKAKPGGDHA